MKAVFGELAERIRGELPELGRAVSRAVASWSRAERIPDESAYLDSVALNMHGFYSGLERLFELIARHVDGVRPVGETWHRDLLRRMAQDVVGVRPAVISQSSTLKLDEFRRFRHLVRNVYTMNIAPDRMRPLVSELPELWNSLLEELMAFSDFTEALAEEKG